MAERLKDIFFTRSSIGLFADTIQRFYSDFDKKKFVDLIFDKTFESKELKEKMAHTTLCLHETLPESYKKALDILKKTAPHVKGFEAISLPDYVALYGMDARDLSLPALAHFTKFSTSELAIRPFLAKDPIVISDDTNRTVRKVDWRLTTSNAILLSSHSGPKDEV